MKITGFLILFLCIAKLVTGQELYGKFLDHKQGLLSKECYDITIGKNGYLLVSTQYGPMKFDGEKFIPICLNIPIERRIIYDFEKDPEGNVYLLNSKNDLFILKGDDAIQINDPHANGIPQNVHLKKIHWHSKGFTIYSSISVYFNYSFQSKKITFDKQTLVSPIHLFIYDPSKEFPFKRYKPGFKRIINYSILFKPFKKTLTQDGYASSEAREDLIRIGKRTYVLINNRLFDVSSPEIRTFPYNDILFIEAFHNRIWLVTSSGLIELNEDGHFIQLHFPKQLIGGVAPLPNGGIAVSLNQHGIFVSSNIDERRYQHIFPTEVAGNGNEILVGSKSNEIYGLINDQLVHLLKPIEWKSSAEHISRDYVRCIEFIDGKWHICAMTGVYTLSPDLRKRNYINVSPANSFNTFFYLKGVLHGASWSDAFLMEQKTNNPIILTKIPCVRCKYTLNDSVILLGSEDGLFEYRFGSRKLDRSKLIKEPYYISHIQSLGPDEFLITTRYKGFFHFKNGKLVQKYSSPCISVKKVVLNKGQFISAGNEGIFVKPQKSNIPWAKIFDGEIENMFLINDRLFICIDDDLIIKKIGSSQKQEKVRVVLNEILLGKRKTCKLPGKIEYNLPITLDFDILRFDAGKLGLYYNLKGSSRSSQYLEGTKISFEALPSGNYVLELFPVIDGKIQFSNSQKYAFTIEEPFWESTLFYILAATVALLILLTIRLIRKLQRKKRSAERAELESKLNEYKLLAVKAQVNPHFLSNGLAAIQALILREDNDLAAQYLAKFSYLMRKILYYSEQQFISIRDELQLVDAYLELELLRFRNKFEIRKSIQLNELQLKNYIIPSLLLQPILENAIWHGLKFQENDPVLYLSFEIDRHQELIIQIQDNGHGFQKHNTSEKHLSKGNQLISERIDALNKQFETPVASLDIQSSLNGTIVRFTFSPKLYNNEGLYY